MMDMETIDLQIEKKVERFRRRYQITNANLAWILLRIGTTYYFKDICSRELKMDVPDIDTRLIANLH